MRIGGTSVLAVAVLVCAVMLPSGRARAGEPIAETSPATTGATAPATAPHWYGGEVLVADGASVALIALGASFRSGPLAGAGVAGWFLAGPIVHGSHVGAGRGVASAALRIGLPLLGVAVGKALSNHCWEATDASDTCDVGAEMAGGLVGVVAAEVIDVAWLARDAHASPLAARHADNTFAQLVFEPLRGGASLGLLGRF